MPFSLTNRSSLSPCYFRNGSGASLLKLVVEPEVEEAACPQARACAKSTGKAVLASALAWVFSLAESGRSFEEMYSAIAPLRAHVRRLLNAQTFAEVLRPLLAKAEKKSKTKAVRAARVLLEISSPRQLDLSLDCGSGCFAEGESLSLLSLLVSELRSTKADAVSRCFFLPNRGLESRENRLILFAFSLGPP